MAQFFGCLLIIGGLLIRLGLVDNSSFDPDFLTKWQQIRIKLKLAAGVILVGASLFTLLFMAAGLIPPYAR